MGAISNDWLAPLSGEFKKPYYKKLYETVKHEYETRQIYPEAGDIFNAFDFTPLSRVKAVILGQDPYHGPGQAHGLCFCAQMGLIPLTGRLKMWTERSSHEFCGDFKGYCAGNCGGFY